MKNLLKNKINNSLAILAKDNNIEYTFNNITVEEPRDPTHGHLASNAAMVLCKNYSIAPRNLAEKIINNIDNSDNYIEKMEIAGPGFINFTLSLNWWIKALEEILNKGENYGLGERKKEKIQVEFVSANPTGPLHVGHGRGAAIGDSLARILKFAGYYVESEYYINDAGRQIQILGNSVFCRIKELQGKIINFPEDHYKGDYIKDIAKIIINEHSDILNSKTSETEKIAKISHVAKDILLKEIQTDLENFNVHFDAWFSEQSLYDNKLVEKSFETLKNNNYLYEKESALWFKSSELLDDKDRVLVKANGEQTYFAADIAYHQNKFQRGFDFSIDIWGADHHGYYARIKAAVEALSYNRDQFLAILVQMVNLLRDGKPAFMSTRAGEFVTLKEVIDEVGVDAARFMFLSRSHDSPLDFDLNLAKTQSKDNPVYYVQYVCARISSILRTANVETNTINLNLLTTTEEINLIKHMATFPEIIQNIALRKEAHLMALYLTNMAKLFHQYYNVHKIITDNIGLSSARLQLIKAIRNITKKGLELLGVTAPERM